MRRGDVRIVLTAAVVGATLLAPIQLTPSNAAASSKASATGSVSTGTLKVFATATQTFTNPAAALSLSAPTKNQPTNFFVENGGTETATGYTITLTPNTGSIVTLKYCPLGVNFSGNGTCASGSATSVSGITSGVGKAIAITFPSSNYFAFQVVTNQNSNTVTIATSVLSSQAVSGTTNS